MCIRDSNIAVLKNEIQGLAEQKNKLYIDNKAIDAKLREYDSVKKNLEKIIEGGMPTSLPSPRWL